MSTPEPHPERAVDHESADIDQPAVDRRVLNHPDAAGTDDARPRTLDGDAREQDAREQSAPTTTTGTSPSSSQPATNRDGVPLARVRRAPRVLPFLLTGAVIGALVGLFVSLDGGDGGNYTSSSSTGYLVVLFGALGALAGGLVFVVADRRS